MGGGTLQLVIYGEQDLYIMGNPEYSFFKTVYRKHTNFSIESIEQICNGNNSSDEITLEYTINKCGDLLYKSYLDIDFPKQDLINKFGGNNYCTYSNNTAFAYIKNIELLIGEKLIDRQDGNWLDIMNELNHQNGGIDYLVNRQTSGVSNNLRPRNIKTYIPLDFWFCKHPSNALPIIALQYHDVKLSFNFRSIKSILNSKTQNPDIEASIKNADPSSTHLSSPEKPNIRLWCDYIYLDKEERIRFAQNNHEYLIEQVQKVSRSYAPTINISLNHPVKCLYWIIQNNIANSSREDYFNIDPERNTYGDIDASNPSLNLWTNSNDYLNYRTHQVVNPSYLYSSNGIYEHFKKMTILFNGIERFAPREPTYFRTVQPYECKYTIPEKSIYIYSFCLDPNNINPTGSCNFSRIDNVSFNFYGDQEYTGYTFNLYATNYNILRIMNGLGGLLYSS